MKVFKRSKYGSLVIILMALVALIQISCSDTSTGGDYTYDAPLALSGVRFVDPDTTVNPEQVGPGDVIVLKGINLNKAAHLYINGLEVSFNPTLTTDSTLIVTIPADMPFGEIDQDGEEMNTIKVTNYAGEAVLDFPVVPSTPQINAISNEFAHDGEQITISGQYLYLATQITFPGGVQATEFEYSADGSSLQVTVPQGAGSEGHLTITTTGGTSPENQASMFRSSEHIFYNFDDKNGFTPWGAEPVITDSYADIPAIDGNYIHWHEENLVIGTWWVQNLATPADGSQLAWPDDIPTSESLADLVLEFELYLAEGINSGQIQFQLAGTDYYWTPWMDGETRTMFTTDGWKTMRIPLDVYADAGLSTYGDIKGQALNLFYVNGTGVDVPLVDAGWDKFRIERVSE